MIRTRADETRDWGIVLIMATAMAMLNTLITEILL